MKYVYNDDKRNELKNGKYEFGCDTPEEVIEEYRGVLEEDKQALKEVKALVDKIKSESHKIYQKYTWDISDLEKTAQDVYEGCKYTVKDSEDNLKDAQRRYKNLLKK